MSKYVIVERRRKDAKDVAPPIPFTGQSGKYYPFLIVNRVTLLHNTAKIGYSLGHPREIIIDNGWEIAIVFEPLTENDAYTLCESWAKGTRGWEAKIIHADFIGHIYGVDRIQ